MIGIDFGKFAGFTAQALEGVCKLVEAHFRSGYVRIADADAIRRVLGS
jgi:hypothetical protein